MKDITRRDFLKIGTAGVTAIQFGGLIPIFGMRGRNNSLYSRRFRPGIPTMCNLCPARCGIIGFLNYEWLAAIQGNPKHINNRGRICARGIAGINQVYDPDRILYPLRRTGARGEGHWKKISWDEALTDISRRLMDIRSADRADEFVFHADAQNVRGLARRLFNTFGKPTILTSSPLEDSNKKIVQKMTWGETTEVNDAANCRYFLSFGSNPFESHPFFINFNQRIIDGKIDQKARLVTIDPRLSNTAGRSDEWIPIKPGTDAMVALAMANVIMQKELYDAQFINQWTNVTVAELKAYLARYNLEEAANISSVEAAMIEKIATEFATNKPAIAFSGGGIAQHVNGTENERCIMLLNAIVGNIDVKGGVCLPRTYQLQDFSLVDDFETNQSSLNFFQDVHTKQKKVGLYFAYMNNPVYEYPDCNLTQAVMKDEQLIPFTVVMDTVMSETAALADLILPAATCVESWDLDSTPSFELIPFVSISQPVIKPLGEAQSLDQVCLALAQRMKGDFERSLNFFQIEDYMKTIAAQIPGLTLAKGFDQLKKHGIWYDSSLRPEYEIYRKKGFNTPSGRFEIAASPLGQRGSRSLPQYVPIREHISIAKDELILIPYHVNVLRPDLSNLKWLAEINHTNQALINARTARRLKIKDGDTIVIESTAGKIEMKAQISQGVHPNVIAISNSLGHWEYGRIARAKNFKSDDPDTSFIWWEEEGHGSHPNFVIPVAMDPIGKGQAWGDTKVKVKRNA